MNTGNTTGQRMVCARRIHREARLDPDGENFVGLLKELATEQA